jgi:diguanylate cyclase (GGDEF)-like protein
MIKNRHWHRLITGNLQENVAPQLYRRLLIMHVFTLMFSVILFLLTLYHFTTGNHYLAGMVAFFTGVAVFSLLHYRFYRDFDQSSTLTAYALFGCLVLYVFINENRDYGLIWTIFFPLYVFFVKGRRIGLYYTLVYYLALFSIAYQGIGIWDGGSWSQTGFVRFVFTSVILTGVLYTFERSSDEAHEMIEALRKRECEQMNRLERLSITDPLTRLYNRRFLDENFMRLFNSAKRHGFIFAMFVIDLDYFKEYNDRYGHQMGDEALQAIADVLMQTLRRSDEYAYRLGGEKFCCLVMADDEKNIIDIANRICDAVTALKIPHEGSSISDVLSTSIGVCLIDQVDHETFDTMYKVADTALYKAKEEGRNRVVVYRNGDL